MAFTELLADNCSTSLPMRARLVETGSRVPSPGSPPWVLQHEWTAMEEEPMLVGVALKLFDLDGVACCAALGRAIAPSCEDPRQEDERAFVYLLSPADPLVWQAIDSWMQVQFISVRTPKYMHATSLSKSDLEVLEARYAEGEELESDLLGGAIQKLIDEGRLEAEVAKQLGITVPLYCAVVETPMLCISLQPVELALWREHVEHHWNRGNSEDVWS